MDALVVDASVAMTWCFPDEQSAYAYRILDILERGRAFVPALWWIEIANAVIAGERRRRLSAADIGRFFGLLEGLSFSTDAQMPEHALGRTLELARRYGLTAYDATYVELAMREGLPLATTDLRVREAARAAGVRIA
jgi:predicted nucleic acid-binding protein